MACGNMSVAVSSVSTEVGSRGSCCGGKSRSAAVSGGTAGACGAAGLLTGSESPAGGASKLSGAKLKSLAFGCGCGPLVLSRLRVVLSGNAV